MSIDDIYGRVPLTVPNLPRLPRMRDEVMIAAKTASEQAFQALVNAIRVFEKTLNPEQEIGAYLVTSASGTSFHIQRLSHHDGVIVFEGTQEGRPISLVQHHTQLNVLLTALPTVHETPIRIGFLISG